MFFVYVCVCVCVCLLGSLCLSLFLMRDDFLSLKCCLDLWLSCIFYCIHNYVLLFLKNYFKAISTAPRHLSSRFSLLWMCLGDYNEILVSKKKQGQISKPLYLMMDYWEALLDCNLVDSGCHGNIYMLGHMWFMC